MPETAKKTAKPKKNKKGAGPKYPGIRVTCNGNTLVAKWVETRITEGGVFYPITPSTEGGELYQQSFAQGELDVWGNQKVAIETEGEHSAQGGATALAVTGRRVVNFTSGQGLAYAMEQYYHAPGKCSTMVLEVGARALDETCPQCPLRARRHLRGPRYRVDNSFLQSDAQQAADAGQSF